jgi:hypothetical protein
MYHEYDIFSENDHARQIEFIVSTLQNSLPLARNFGVNPDLLHENVNQITPLIVSNFAAQFDNYLPELMLETADVSYKNGYYNIEIEVTEND